MSDVQTPFVAHDDGPNYVAPVLLSPGDKIRRRRFRRLVALLFLTSAVLSGVALLAPWWQLVLSSGGSVVETTTGSVYITTRCTSGASGTCTETSAFHDAETTLQIGQLSAGALLILAVISSLFNCLRASAWSTAATDSAAVLPQRQRYCGRSVHVHTWIAFRGALSALYAGLATATFTQQVIAWEAQYIAGLPRDASLTWMAGTGLAATAAVLAGLGATIAGVLC